MNPAAMLESADHTDHPGPNALIIEPINDEQQALVVDATKAYIDLAETLFSRSFAPVDIRFDLAGGSAGMFRVQGRDCHIRYNPWLFAKYFEDNLQGTVPHEVAHYVVHRRYGLHRTRPHGPEWKAVMAGFGADDSVTSDFDLDGIPQRRQRRYDYRCACRTHELSARRHNTIMRGRGRYQCRACNGELFPA